MIKHKYFTERKFLGPIIVVGNITIGGTGKTPLVIQLATWLSEQGFKPAILSKGYKGKITKQSSSVYLVEKNADPSLVGDEAVLLAKRTNCPVIVSSNRNKAIDYILSNFSDITAIVSDDGLQHYALARDIEIMVVDGSRQYGNKHCLPVGPLREPLSRVEQVDFIVENHGTDYINIKSNNYLMGLEYTKIYNLYDHNIVKNISDFKGQKVQAVAGIGNPERLFRELEAKGIEVVPHVFPDHHAFVSSDLDFINSNSITEPVLMTEKDAVKCQSFAKENYWSIAVTAKLPDNLYADLLARIKYLDRENDIGAIDARQKTA